MHAWNQQVVGVIFEETSLQHLAGASHLSSPRQLPVMVISYSFFSNAHAQTHAHLHNHSRNSCTSTFAHVHTLERACSFSPSLFFDNTTSSLTSSRSAPLSVLQQELLLWATREFSLTFSYETSHWVSLQGPTLYNLYSLYRTSISVQGISLWKHRGRSWDKAIWCFVANVSEVMDTVWKATAVWVKWQS